jgi:hypothetical protein
LFYLLTPCFSFAILCFNQLTCKKHYLSVFFAVFYGIFAVFVVLGTFKLSSNVKPESNLTDLAFAVLFLAVLALLTANILIYSVAAKHNDDVCRNITIAAARAAVDGGDNRGVYTAALQEVALAGYGGFFIDAPKLVGFSDSVKDNKRRITVQTQCFARIPVRRLIAADDINKALLLKRTYVAEIGLSPDPQKSEKPADNEQDSQSTESQSK